MSSPRRQSAPTPTAKKRSGLPPSQQLEGFNHSLMSQRMRPKSPPIAIRRFDEVCLNCKRPLIVEGRDEAVRDGDDVYCCKNCLWSSVMDPAGARHKLARRVKQGKPKRKRKKRVPNNVVGDNDGGKEEEGTEVGMMDHYKEVHALYEFHHCMFGGMTGIGEARNTVWSSKGSSSRSEAWKYGSACCASPKCGSTRIGSTTKYSGRRIRDSSSGL